jgi:hypothetical protein
MSLTPKVFIQNYNAERGGVAATGWAVGIFCKASFAQ